MAAATAQEVAASCRELLKPTPPKSFDVGLCVGSFTTLYALSSVVDQNQAPILGFCRPPKAEYVDLVRVFVRHVETHPQTAQVYYAIEAVNALVDAYPCRRKP
ncbi:MAG: Rap1a/Tai family immunity protein [Pseudomonadota bacterium]